MDFLGRTAGVPLSYEMACEMLPLQSKDAILPRHEGLFSQLELILSKIVGQRTKKNNTELTREQK